MSKKEETLWNRFSKIYDSVMKKDKKAYENIIIRISNLLNADDKILEIGTGTGIISIGLAKGAKKFNNIEATDFSPDMLFIAEKKTEELGINSINFSIQNADNLKYDSHIFDSVIISNTLHIMPNPQKGLSEIKRVLKPEGMLIAPTFVHADSIKAKILSRIISVTGFKAYHKWTKQTYCMFLEDNGFNIVNCDLLKASFPIAYTVAKQNKNYKKQ